MEISKVRIIVFSPTGTSLAVAKGVARGMAHGDVVITDLTPCGSYADIEMGANELAVVAVPVYGGHVAPPARRRMEQTKGCGTPAVAVAVYGNRDFEGALDELATMLEEAGFKVIGGAAFVGEHSYSTTDTPIAAGRPDAKDMAAAESFGRAVMTKVGAANSVADITTPDITAIPRPRQPENGYERFVEGVTKMKAEGIGSPKCPDTDTELCSGCGVCADVCPTGAINAAEPACTKADLCIKCCACVKACLAGARTMATPYAPVLCNIFSDRKEPVWIL